MNVFFYFTIFLNNHIFISFLEVGHTQNKGDSMHARIENHTKNRSIFTQQEWARQISQATVKEPFYQVKEVKQEEIYNFDSLSEFFNWSKAKISTVWEFHVTPGNDTIDFKTNFFDKLQSIKILKKNKNLKDVINHPIMAAYNKLIPLNKTKRLI